MVLGAVAARGSARIPQKAVWKKVIVMTGLEIRTVRWMLALTATWLQPGRDLTAAQVGTLAPAWTLDDVSGRTIRSSDFAGRVVLLNFFTPGCAPCAWEMPDLIALQNERGSNGLAIVGVGVNQSSAELLRFVAGQNINFIVCSSVESILWDYGFYPQGGLPFTCVIDRTGRLAAQYRFFKNKAYHESVLQPLLNAPAPGPRLNITRAGTDLLLSWPADLTNYLIECRSMSLPGQPWAQPAQAPRPTNGWQTLGLSARAGGWIFRLRRIGP